MIAAQGQGIAGASRRMTWPAPACRSGAARLLRIDLRRAGSMQSGSGMMINVHAAESGLPRVCLLPQHRPQSGGTRGRASGKPDQQCFEVAAWAVLSSGMGALSIFDPRPAGYWWPIAAASSWRTPQRFRASGRIHATAVPRRCGGIPGSSRTLQRRTPPGRNADGARPLGSDTICWIVAAEHSCNSR
jgi:hypothetical protein